MDRPAAQPPDLLAPYRLKRELAAKAHELHFDACRVTGPAAPAEELQRHRLWLSEGNAAQLAYLARQPENRYDARYLLPACQSVIVLAMSYHQGQASNNRTLSAVGQHGVARYAWGEDYHRVLLDKAEELASWLHDRCGGHEYRITVDSAPLAEKAFAVAAGIGWRGRNTLVLSEELGSWQFLACLLTSLQLPPDLPVADRCGACRKCIDACPAGALAYPAALDVRRCVSYHTSSKSMPAGGRRLHGWLLGCDACQLACPYNRAPQVAREPRFARRPGIAQLNAETVLAMDEQEYQRLYGDTVLAEKSLLHLQAVARMLAAEPPDRPASDGA